MTKYDDIDRYLEEADAHVIPQEFISSACVVTKDGDEYYATIEEVADILEAGSFEEQGIEYIRAIINFPKVKETVIALSEEILNSITF